MHPNSIALSLGLSTEQVQIALRYIEEHRDEVMTQYQKILDRCARGNPPELQAKLDANHEKFLAWARQRRSTKENGAGHARDPG